jgi:hypothetical protein
LRCTRRFRPASWAPLQAAIGWAEGDAATARRKVEETRALLPRLADRGGAVVLAENLDDITRDLDQNRTDATALAAQA